MSDLLRTEFLSCSVIIELNIIKYFIFKDFNRFDDRKFERLDKITKLHKTVLVVLGSDHCLKTQILMHLYYVVLNLVAWVGKSWWWVGWCHEWKVARALPRHPVA